MKKITKKKVVKKEIDYGTEVDLYSEPTEGAKIKGGMGKLDVTFQNVDMNKVVEKINELIDKSNDSI